jgi:hypothetical protein
VYREARTHKVTAKWEMFQVPSDLKFIELNSYTC